MNYAFLSVAVFALNVMANIILWCSAASIIRKILWSLVIFGLPVLGLVLWYFNGPGEHRTSRDHNMAPTEHSDSLLPMDRDVEVRAQRPELEPHSSPRTSQ